MRSIPVLRRSFWFGTLMVFAASSAAVAQPASWNSTQAAKLERLERDMMALQRQVYRGEAPAPGTNQGYGQDTAAIDVRISQLEEQMRRIMGKLEELEHRQRQLQQTSDARFEQIETKLFALEEKSMTAAQQPAAATPSTATAAPTDAPPPTIVKGGQAMNEEQARKLYHQAFQALNQSKRDEARQMFTQFTQNHPKHELSGNAYYWMGETYYAEKEYLQAADKFRQGYEAKPTGNKAPDNLLKLGMSLANIEKKREACIVYGQLESRFPAMNSNLKTKLAKEKASAGCGQ
jgi:tol-pal system protein YbgF